MVVEGEVSPPSNEATASSAGASPGKKTPKKPPQKQGAGGSAAKAASPAVAAAAEESNVDAAAEAAPAAAESSVTDPPSSSTASFTASTVPTTSPPSSTAAKPPVRRRKAAPAPRPTTGGLSIGFTPAELAEQARRRQQWARAEVEETMEIRRKVKAASEKSSDSALRVVLIVWALVCFAIFYHVWSTIQRGADHLAAQSDELSVPASEAILNTFRAQKRDTM